MKITPVLTGDMKHSDITPVLTGDIGFEPIRQESKSCVLPIHQSPKNSYKNN